MQHQRLLTAEAGVCSGVLEGCERRVDLEAFGEVLGSLSVEVIAAKAANEDRGSDR